VEYFAQGYYLAHGLARLFARRHWLAEREEYRGITWMAA
jgi:hypothetical protein